MLFLFYDKDASEIPMIDAELHVHRCDISMDKYARRLCAENVVYKPQREERKKRKKKRKNRVREREKSEKQRAWPQGL